MLKMVIKPQEKSTIREIEGRAPGPENGAGQGERKSQTALSDTVLPFYKKYLVISLYCLEMKILHNITNLHI